MYIIGRVADPIFGLASGLLAFKLKDEREARRSAADEPSPTNRTSASSPSSSPSATPPPLTFAQLLRWKYGSKGRGTSGQDEETIRKVEAWEEREWDKLRKEIELAEATTKTR